MCATNEEKSRLRCPKLCRLETSHAGDGCAIPSEPREQGLRDGALLPLVLAAGVGVLPRPIPRPCLPIRTNDRRLGLPVDSLRVSKHSTPHVVWKDLRDRAPRLYAVSCLIGVRGLLAPCVAAPRMHVDGWRLRHAEKWVLHNPRNRHASAYMPDATFAGLDRSRRGRLSACRASTLRAGSAATAEPRRAVSTLQWCVV